MILKSGMIGSLKLRYYIISNKQAGGEAGVKSFRKELWFQTSERREFINITPQLQRACIMIWKFGWRNWRRRSPIRSIDTTGMRIMPMHILNGR